MSILPRFLRHLPELAGLAAVLWIQFQVARRLLASPAARGSRILSAAIRALAALAAIWMTFGIAASLPRAYMSLPSSPALYWVRGAALGFAIATLAAWVLLFAWRRVPGVNAERRGFLRAAGGLFVAAPFGAMGFGILVQRKQIRVREIDVPVANLPKDLRGLRIAQLSDIHLSPFLSESELARAVEIANDFRPHLAVVTGDLITSQGDPLEACLRGLARLRADAGTLGCLGNHEIYARAEEAATLGGARAGIVFLRRQARRLRFGDSVLNIAGVDYQKMGSRYLTGAERLLAPGAVNILLSHNPDVFEVAAAQGWDVTLSGHTHGGQVTVEILSQTLNVARFFTPYVYGLYRRGPSSIWVTRGIGTVGVPARIGAPPEVAIVRLCAT